MQKPVQIFHTIILDKKHSGLQTMGTFFFRQEVLNRLLVN